MTFPTHFPSKPVYEENASHLTIPGAMSELKELSRDYLEVHEAGENDAYARFRSSIFKGIALEKLEKGINQLALLLNVDMSDDRKACLENLIHVRELLQEIPRESIEIDIESKMAEAASQIEASSIVCIRKEMLHMALQVVEERGTLARTFETFPQELKEDSAQFVNAFVQVLGLMQQDLSQRELMKPLQRLSNLQMRFSERWMPEILREGLAVIRDNKRAEKYFLAKMEEMYGSEEELSQNRVEEGIKYYLRNRVQPEFSLSKEFPTLLKNGQHLLERSVHSTHREQKLQRKLLEASKLLLEGKDASPSSMTPPSADTVLDRCFAVHATSYADFLKQGVLTPTTTRGIDCDRLVKSEEQNFRLTLHWALNGLVPPHNGKNQQNSNYTYSWENSPIAVIAPIRSLLPNLINVFGYDSFMLGPFDPVQNPCVILLPENFDGEIHPGIRDRVQRYPQEKGLRSAVEKYLKEKQAYNEMLPGFCDIGANSYQKGHECNNYDFFRPFLQSKSHISFGSHVQSVQGNASLWGQSEQMMAHLLTLLSDPSLLQIFSHEQLEFIHIECIYLIERLQEEDKLLPLDETVKSLTQNLIKKYEKWLAVTDILIGIYHEKGKLFSLSQIQLTALYHMDNELVRSKIEEFLDFDNPSDAGEEDNDALLKAKQKNSECQFFPECFTAFEVEQLLSKSRLDPESDRIKRGKLFHSLNRMLIMGSQLNEKESQTLRSWVREFAALYSRENEFIQMIWDKAIVSHLTIYLDTLVDTLNLLSSEELRPLTLAWGLDPASLATLDDLIETHPKTRKAFDIRSEDEPIIYELRRKMFNLNEKEARKSFKAAEEYAKSLLG